MQSSKTNPFIHFVIMLLASESNSKAFSQIDIDTTCIVVKEFFLSTDLIEPSWLSDYLRIIIGQIRAINAAGMH